MLVASASGTMLVCNLRLIKLHCIFFKIPLLSRKQNTEIVYNVKTTKRIHIKQEEICKATP